VSKTKRELGIFSIYKNAFSYIINFYVKISRNFLKSDIGIFFLFVPLYFFWVEKSTISLLTNYNLTYSETWWSFIQISILISFIGLSYLYFKAYKNKNRKAKLWILALFFLFFINIFTLKIDQRFDKNIYSDIHDGLPQIEASIDFFLQGKNPYQEDYYNTVFGEHQQYKIIKISAPDIIYSQLNPAFENYVYPPAQFVLAAPLKLLSETLFDLYDHRFFILFCFIVSIFVIYRLPESEKNKFSLLIVYLLNPLFLDSIAYGYNDVTAMLPLLFALYLLKKNKFTWSIFFVTISILIKYNTIFYLPFFLIYIFQKQNYKLNIKSLLKFCKYLIPIIIPAVFLFLPWLVWDPKALYHDTVFYLNHTYPIRSLGLSAYWLKLGIVQSPFEYHPFWLYQLIFILLVLPPLVKKQLKNNDISNIYLAGTVVAGGVYFFYRYFTSNQLILIFHNILISLFI